MSIIRLNNVSLSYFIREGVFRRREIKALKDISLEIEKGTMTSIIGMNGAGKTTLLSVISGILTPDSGTVAVQGKVVPILGLGVGFNPELTAEENLYLYSALMGISRKDILSLYKPIVEFAELDEFMDLKIKEFSTGMYMRLGFAIAVHTRPEILIIDEVLSVGDYAFQRKCINRIMELKRNGVTILFVSHYMGLVSRYSDSVILLEKGILRSQGKPVDTVEEFINMKKLEYSQTYKREGSQEVTIESITLSKDKAYSKGDEIIISVKYRNNDNIDRGIIGFALYSENGTLIAGPNAKDDGAGLIKFKERGTVNASFSSSLLNPGHYYITVGIYDETNKFPFDRHDYAEDFTVSGLSREYMGSTDLNVKWDI